MKALALDPYVVDTLMRDLVSHDHSPSAFLVYLKLAHLTSLDRRGKVVVSLRGLADDTGLSKSAVQSAIRLLEKRRLIQVERAAKTTVPSYGVLKPWQR